MIDNLRKRYEQLQGLLNTPANQGGGLLGNISQGAFLGSAIYGQGIQGKDPFAALLPAATQTAQLQKYMTPKDTRTPLQKNLEAAGLKPGTPEYQAALLEATKKQPLIQQTGENAFTKRMGEIYGDEFKNILSGIEMIEKELQSTLEKNSIKYIDCLDKPFDPNLHQAIGEKESDKSAGTVVEEMQKGYQMHDRLLRPSMVYVSKKSDK